jgi:hypothetical protein
MLLTRLSPRGRKRTKLRVEELVRISVHGIVTNRGGPHTVYDKNGTKLQFVDEAEMDGRMVLRVYQNSRPILTYQLAEKPIGGKIKNQRHWWADCQYYVLVNGRRYSYLYIDTKGRKIGTKDCFGALWTSQSISPKQRDDWRGHQRRAKREVRVPGLNRSANDS